VAPSPYGRGLWEGPTSPGCPGSSVTEAHRDQRTSRCGCYYIVAKSPPQRAGAEHGREDNGTMPNGSLIGLRVIAPTDIHYNVPRNSTGTIAAEGSDNDILVNWDNGVSGWCKKYQVNIL